jgi:hypothetical protein
MRRRKAQPFLGDTVARVRFERGARQAYPGLHAHVTRRGWDGEIVYRLRMEVPQYEARHIEIRLFCGARPAAPIITVDGPTLSPHRYGEHRLCLYKPRDPDEQRWVAADGLLELINQIKRHLFKEAWWRETGEWLGAEAPHDPLPREDAALGEDEAAP